IGEPEGYAEVLRHPADQEGGLHPGALQQPGEKRGGRGLAVCSRDGDRMAGAEELLLDYDGRGGVVQALVEDRLQLRIAAGDGVAYDHYVGSGRVLRPDAYVDGAEPLGVPNAEFAELVRHRRVDI